MSNYDIKETNIATEAKGFDALQDDAFYFKGSSYTITTFQITTTNIDLIESQLLEKLKKTFNFFYNAPVIIDLQIINAINPHAKIKLGFLKQVLINNNLVPTAVTNASLEQQKEAIDVGLAIMHSSINKNLKDDKIEEKKQYEETKFKENTEPKAKIEQPPQTQSTVSQNSTLITENVRSGQQIYAKGGDLIVMATVSQGAELLADGHIHIYGCLRGRALAGVNGDTTARIFCNKLEAELVSVAGQYMLSEKIEKTAWGKPSQIYIVNQKLEIDDLFI